MAINVPLPNMLILLINLARPHGRELKCYDFCAHRLRFVHAQAVITKKERVTKTAKVTRRATKKNEKGMPCLTRCLTNPGSRRSAGQALIHARPQRTVESTKITGPLAVFSSLSLAFP